MGVFCRPAGIADAPVLVFTNAGHDYHIGWARVTVMLARELAKAGYASLRFDMPAGVRRNRPGEHARRATTGYEPTCPRVKHLAQVTNTRS